jgi:hypothetical protein
MKNLTYADIRSIRKNKQLSIDLYKERHKCLNSSNYFLIVHSSTNEFSKITIYPINKERIVKVKIYDNETNPEKIRILKKFLTKVEIIHTTGLILEGKELSYEFYLNKSKKELDLRENKGFVKRIDKLKKIFKFLRIEEIILEKD